MLLTYEKASLSMLNKNLERSEPWNVLRRRTQERRFYQKLNIERQWKKIHSEGSSRQSPVPVPPQDDLAAMKKIRMEEYKELMKLKEMERKKRELEDEIEREKRHLIGLQQLEQVSFSTQKDFLNFNLQPQHLTKISFSFAKHLLLFWRTSEAHWPSCLRALI